MSHSIFLHTANNACYGKLDVTHPMTEFTVPCSQAVRAHCH